MAAYYNENEPFAADWLRELIKDGLIADGEVDDRSVADVRPDDLRGFTQHHFFAGIGGWSCALRLAGWPDDRPVWTGSCPCQPFSVAGKQAGAADKRHLWPTFHALIAECQPATVFGEQVASKLGREWLSGVRADLESSGYACGAADLCAAGVGAPHIRQRLWWVGHSHNARCETRDSQPIGDAARPECSAEPGSHGGVADAPGGRCGQRNAEGRQLSESDQNSGVGDSENNRQPREQATRARRPRAPHASGVGGPHGGVGGADFWEGEYIPCADGKARRTQPGIFPLADGVSSRVGTLRGAGNAIVPQVAAVFVRAFMEAA